MESFRKSYRESRCGLVGRIRLPRMLHLHHRQEHRRGTPGMRFRGQLVGSEIESADDADGDDGGDGGVFVSGWGRESGSVCF
jgi:hypothetical protein